MHKRDVDIYNWYHNTSNEHSDNYSNVHNDKKKTVKESSVEGKWSYCNDVYMRTLPVCVGGRIIILSETLDIKPTDTMV